MVGEARRLFQCLLANFVRLRQVLILALDFSSGPLTNFKGALPQDSTWSLTTQSNDHEPEMAPLNAQRLVVVHTALVDLQPGSS